MATNNPNNNPNNNRHRKQRPNERQLPNNLDLKESQLYSRLQQMERQLDTILIRKRLDIQEALSKPLRTSNTLRLLICNSFNSDDGFFSFKIRGNLLHSSDSTDGQFAFSSLVKSCIVELSSHGHPSETVQVCRFLSYVF